MRRDVAKSAAALVESGMRVGLGTGRTAALFVDELGRRAREEGLKLITVATSLRTATQARDLGLPLCELDEVDELDLCVDGADEVAPSLDLVKGLGGALLREKLVASAARRLVIVIDGEKRVQYLGERAPIPVEVVPFGWTHTAQRLGRLGLAPTLREGRDGPVITDGGHYLLDCRLLLSIDPRLLGAQIKGTLGVVEHGLFLGLTSQVLVGTPAGVELLLPPPVA